MYSAYSQSNDNGVSCTLFSGDDQLFTDDDLIGETTLFFYESRKNSEVNLDLKFSLAKNELLLKTIRPQITVLASTNCNAAVWPFIKLWEKGLINKSISEGHKIYGDWIKQPLCL